MNRLVLLTAVATLAGCGSPAGPSANPVAAPAAIGASLSYYSVGHTAQGLGSPTTVTVGLVAMSGVSPGAIEGAAFKVIGEQGETLAEAALLTYAPIPVGAGSNPATVRQTLTWEVENGYGRRLDVLVTVRDGAGNTRVLPFSRIF